MSDFGDVMLSLYPDLIRLLVILLAALALIGAAWLASRIGRRQLERVQRLAAIDQAARTPVTRPMDLGDLVISPEQERHAAWQADRLRETRADLPAVRCHRHRTGSTAWPCTCGRDEGGAS